NEDFKEVTILDAPKPQNPIPQKYEIPVRDVQYYESKKIAKSVKPQIPSPQDYTIPARDVQFYARRQPAIRKPTTYKSTIENYVEWIDGLLRRNQTCLGGHWLPAGPLSYHFEAFTIGISRQIADVIELKGYCVEPDARFGSGTYGRNQTLAIFKPLDGDPIQPSTAYLGAANLLRLCILIATADGKLDVVELDAFRSAIENQAGLTKTDRKRLIVLEQLLAQELCSAAKAVPRIAKSVSAENRLVIGKLLVEVAAANNVITDGEHRALEKIFGAFEIPPETLEKLITQICPSHWPRPESHQGDVSKNDKWHWNYWRTSHPGVVIDDDTLAKKRWNFNDWKALNARWRALCEQLDPRASKSPHEAGATAKASTWREVFQAGVRKLGIKSEQNPKPIPAPKSFALDMARVYEITSETKEVVAILSVLMEDEPEKSIAPSATITLPVPEIPKVSSDGNAAPQPTRFNGLDAAFRPILERLLACDSWSKNDFKLLADEFHFMPLNIRDTLNEWSDEMLGDYILDGEDPLIVHRELIGKDKVYG
ncbi:MAG: tellurite resistance TerB C-terminal domain-containing protein, partial [Limisphaerales bacterium]